MHIPNSRPLPDQNSDRIMLHAQRWRRDADALREWSATAKKAVDYFEGRQWAAADLAKLRAEKRPALTLNKIRPLVNLVMGYFLNQRTDIRFLPGYDGTGTAETAGVLTHIEKQIADASQLGFINAEVFLDGLLTGRGFYGTNLSFADNDLGEVKTKAIDPFTVYPDADADEYDLNSGSHISKSRMVSIEEVVLHYGAEAGDRLGPFMARAGVTSGMPSGLSYNDDEISPRRRFGMDEDDAKNWRFGDFANDFIDTSRKTIRLLDIEHYLKVRRWFFVDLETGTSRPVPDEWDSRKIDRALAWSQEQGQPMVVQQRLHRRLRSTHMVGDVIVYDEWSPYGTMTLTGFFPYFRRGMTQGMVEHLTDAQDEVNKRRSARLNMIGRSSNGGWIYEKGSLDAQGKQNLERYGSTPGVHVEHDTKGGTLKAPAQIQPAAAPIAMTQLEHEAEDDLKKISGVNDSALGIVEQAVVSGAAIERRQRQTIIGLEHYVANFKRSQELKGRKDLSLIQNFYTEERIVRVTGTGNTPIAIAINQRTAAGIVNDVTLGSYAVAVDETPMSRSFMEAQFEELQALKASGMPIPDDFIIDASSIPRKEELKIKLAEARQQMAAAGVQPGDAPGGPKGAAGPGPGGSQVGRDGGSMPAGPERGAPPPPPQPQPAQPSA